MIEWNRDVASVIQISLVVIFFILLLTKKNKLGKGIIYFMIAGGIVACLDTFNFTMHIFTNQFNSIPIYTVGVNFGVFLLFFLYFRRILELEKSKKINLIIIIIFIASYISFAVFSENFFNKFPFKFYFIEVILLTVNIFLVLRETFNSDKILNIKSYYPFWACIGLMSIYLGVAPLLIISNTAIQLMNINIFFIILFIVNVIGYSILIMGIFFAKNINIKK
ncbi:hypothetical protein [Chryseobacterium sp. MDT2-18]|uniref:hypothetical protein n=1 Tax=Chryseobacterium sp. MDT2-18 TaxID=1259136 RepID=UPI0027833FE4|nr:hypothetical protein [Chryseobacterium sp. MDT2-18]MDQ0475804.1 hypothetical protein [Chryseobacterium sp. MDT2-18]